MTKTNLPLRTELDGVWYLDAHPQVAEHFKIGKVSHCVYYDRGFQETILLKSRDVAGRF